MTIFELLKQNGLMQNEGIGKTDLLEYQKKLYNAGKATIPLSYGRFLQECNGIQTDTLALFGANPSRDSFVQDIFERNDAAGLIKQNDKIFLGDNFSEYLCYTWSQKSYNIIDKETLREKLKFPYMEQALQFFLRDYIKQGNTTEKTIEKLER